VGERLHWFRHGAVQLPWGFRGPADAPLAIALPGLSDGLLPLSEVGGHGLGGGHGGRRLPFRALMTSYRHPVDTGIGTRDLAADVAALLDEVADAPVAVVGHSMGGMVAQWLAATRPDLVRHLVLTATLARPVPALRQVLEAWESLVVAGRWRDFAAAANEASYTGAELRRRWLLLRLWRPPRMPHLVERHRALTAATLAHDATDVLGAIACPTLVLAGSQDPVVPPSASRALAAAIPGAEYEELPGLAHGFPEQAPGPTLAAITARLDPEGQVRA
jgi:3-oxoadipate enol-lactonase